MAGLDRMYDARGFIQNYIEKRIRELLEDPMNEYQDPNWVQAALLFDQSVVPCERYMMEHLYTLAQDIVKKANEHHNMWISQVIPEMYNEKNIDPTSIDMDNLPKGTEVRDFNELVDNIKKWMATFEANKIDLINFSKGK